MEQTFAIIKPHAVADKVSGKIIDMIEAAGFKIVRLEKVTMSKAQAEDLYVEHKERSFYNGMISTMTSSPVIVMKLQKDGAVLAWRDLIGATNPSSAAAGTIRALFGKSLDENTVHGSDSAASASRELAIFFGACC